MKRTVVVTGGGSGGHITPILAVAAELKRLDPAIHLVYVGQRGDNLADIPARDPNIDEVRAVFAGKFRRYHGEGWRQLLDISTMLKNSRDAVYVLIGIFQGWRLMGELRPSVVFSRGAYVSVPVCLGAALRRVPYITHDSDPLPSLANRLIARWARWHAVAWPTELYPYPPAKTVTTGIPLAQDFVPVTPELRQRYREELQLPKASQLLFIIGGGLGSVTVNHAVAAALPHLLHEFDKLQVVHVVGRANEAAMRRIYNSDLTPGEYDRVEVLGFTSDVHRYSGAADVVITRAGATNLAEFALQGKACIVIPSSFLVGGHQLNNAEYLAEQEAALVIGEADLVADTNRLTKQVARLLHDPHKRQQLSDKLANFAKPSAAADLAKLILEQPGQ